MTIGIVDIHKISSFFKVYTAALISMHHNHEWIDLKALPCWGAFSLKIFYDEKRMMYIIILIHIHFLYYFISFGDELISFFLYLFVDDIGIC